MAVYKYKLIFGNTVDAPSTAKSSLVVTQHEDTHEKDTDPEFTFHLHGFKLNKKIYQPNEIEAEVSVKKELQLPRSMRLSDFSRAVWSQ